MFVLVHYPKKDQWLEIKPLFSQCFCGSVTLTHENCYQIEIASDESQSELSIRLFHFFKQQMNDSITVLLAVQKAETDIREWKGLYISSEIYYNLTTVANWSNIGIHPCGEEILNLYKLDQKTTSKPTLVGREEELVIIKLFINNNDHKALIIEGESGIGKSALIDSLEFNSEKLIADKFTTINSPLWWSFLNDKSFIANENLSIESPEQIAENLIRKFSTKTANDYVFLLDDFQWADEHSLRIIKSLLERQYLPFKLILCSRPSLNIDSILQNQPKIMKLNLSRLSPEACLEWINTTYPNLLSDKQINKLITITNGHALLLKELSKGVIENKIDYLNLNLKENKIINIGSDIAYSLLANSYDLESRVKQSLRTLCEIDHEFDEDLVLLLKSKIEHFSTISELVATGIIEEVKHKKYFFSHHLIKEAFKKDTNLENKTSVLTILANILFQKKRFSEATKLYNSLHLTHQFSKSCFRNIKQSYLENQLSVVIEHSNYFLNQTSLSTYYKKERQQVFWYHGVALAGLGYIHTAYSSLGNYLESINMTPKTTQIFRMLQILFLPKFKVRDVSSCNNESREKAIIALRYRLENGWVESLSKNSLSDAINYYKLDKSLQNQSKFKAEGGLYFGLAVSGNISKTLGRRIIRDSLRELRSLSSKSIHYYKFALLHYRLGSTKWMHSYSLINSIYKNEKKLDAATIGKTRLDEVIYLIMLDKRNEAISRCIDSLSYLKSHKIDWIYQVLLTVQAHLLMHNQEYDKALFILNKVTNESIKELHSYLSVKSTLLLLKGDIKESTTIMEKATLCLRNVKFNDYSRSSYLADTLLTIHVLLSLSKSHICRKNLKILKKHIFVNSKFFECYIPIKNLFIQINRYIKTQTFSNKEINYMLEHCSTFQYNSILNYFNLFLNTDTNKKIYASPCQISLFNQLKSNLKNA